MSTGKWCQEGVPHKGWTCVDVEDLGEPSETCGMCEVQEIRYVHIMQHPDYAAGPLRCGCICAGHMEEDLIGARHREKAAARKSRWLKRRWYRQIHAGADGWIEYTGLEYVNTDGYHISVYPRRGVANTFGFQITNRDTDYKLVARKSYASLDAAKLTALDALFWLKDRGL